MSFFVHTAARTLLPSYYPLKGHWHSKGAAPGGVESLECLLDGVAASPNAIDEIRPGGEE